MPPRLKKGQITPIIHDNTDYPASLPLELVGFLDFFAGKMALQELWVAQILEIAPNGL